jgi:multicomponent K+:H+ antiporter subunit G
MPEPALPLLSALFSLAGSFFFLSAAIGLLRLPDFYTRTHAPNKAATLGLLLIAVGSMLAHVGQESGLWLEDLLLVIFVFLTVPVSSQMLVRAAVARGIVQYPGARDRLPLEPVARVDEA